MLDRAAQARIRFTEIVELERPIRREVQHSDLELIPIQRHGNQQAFISDLASFHIEPPIIVQPFNEKVNNKTNPQAPPFRGFSPRFQPPSSPLAVTALLSPLFFVTPHSLCSIRVPSNRHTTQPPFELSASPCHKSQHNPSASHYPANPSSQPPLSSLLSSKNLSASRVHSTTPEFSISISLTSSSPPVQKRRLRSIRFPVLGFLSFFCLS